MAGLNAFVIALPIAGDEAAVEGAGVVVKTRRAMSSGEIRGGVVDVEVS